MKGKSKLSKAEKELFVQLIGSIDLFDAEWLGRQPPRSVRTVHLVKTEQDVWDIDEREEKVAVKAHSGGDEMPYRDMKKMGALDEQIRRWQNAGDNTNDTASDVNGVPTLLMADLQCGHKPAHVVRDVSRCRNEKSGGRIGAALTKGDVIKKKEDGDVVMDDPEGRLRRGGGMHDISGGGVVEVEGEDYEKGCMGERGITIDRVLRDWGRAEEEVEVDYALEELESEIEETAIPFVTLGEGEGAVSGKTGGELMTDEEIEELEGDQSDGDDDEIGRVGEQRDHCKTFATKREMSVRRR